MCPNKLLKDVIESAPIFNDLKDKTDVYVSSYVIPKSKTATTRYVRAIFKNPYCKANRADTINLEATAEDEMTVFEKLKKISTELPIYKNFKEIHFRPQNNIIFPEIKRIFLGKNGCDGFIQQGQLDY